MLGHFRKAKVPPKRIVKEFPVTPDAHVPIGEPPSKMCRPFFEFLLCKEQPCLPYIMSRGNMLMWLQIRAFSFFFSIEGKSSHVT
jgi:hypothetical protein